MELKKRQFSVSDWSIEPQDGKYAVNLVAFSGLPFSHWYWKRCVFDRSGCVIAQPKIPLDYNHESTEAIGFLEKFGGDPVLECSGFLLPFKDGDRANEIIAKKEAGMPYQCSVTLGDNIDAELVNEGETAEVNGQTVEGPICIFRKFEVIGVAICLYGSDGNTKVFNNEGKEADMPVEAKDTKLDLKAAQEVAKLFAKKFGAERGFKYFSEGLDEAKATEEFAEELQLEAEDKDKKIAELEAKIAELEAAAAAKEAEQAPPPPEEAAAFEEEPVSEEDKEKFKRMYKALFGGEKKPLPNGTAAPAKKEFSAIPPKLRGFAKKITNNE